MATSVAKKGIPNEWLSFESSSIKSSWCHDVIIVINADYTPSDRSSLLLLYFLFWHQWLIKRLPKGRRFSIPRYILFSFFFPYLCYLVWRCFCEMIALKWNQNDLFFSCVWVLRNFGLSIWFDNYRSISEKKKKTIPWSWLRPDLFVGDGGNDDNKNSIIHILR